MRYNPVRFARSAAAIGSLGVGFAAGATAAAVNGNRRSGSNLMSVIGTELALAAAGVNLNVYGEANLWEQRPAIFAFNHQSQLDMPIMGALLRKDFTGVAKRSLKANPVFGPVGYLADVAFIDRSDPKAAQDALKPVVEALREGTSLAVAPEGTRSGPGVLLPFKKGPFHMAIQGQVPMVPVVIRNAGEIMRPHSYLITPGTVDVAVLPPVETSSWSGDTVDELRGAVRALLVGGLANWASASST